MRIKRQAKARKSLEFFVRAFSFEEPFKFLVDPDFLLGLLKSGLNLRLALQNLISVKDKDCKIFLTTCIRRELEALSVTPGPRLGEWKGALAMVDNRDNNIHYVACKHPKTLKCNAHQCIKWSMAPAQLTAELEGKAAAIADESDDEPEVKKKSSGSNFKGNARVDSKVMSEPPTTKKKKEKKANPEHFIACVQHSELRGVMRSLPAVPTVYLHSNTLVFDDPSEATKLYAARFKVSHHNKISSKQNLSILESLQRYAPEKNQVLESVLENGGVFGNKFALPEGVPTSIIQGTAVTETKPLPHIGKKHKPQSANPLSKKKAQPKQMPAMSFKTQKKLEAAGQVVKNAKKVVQNAVSIQPTKKQKGNQGQQQQSASLKKKNDDGNAIVQLPKAPSPPPASQQLPKLSVATPAQIKQSQLNEVKKRKLGQM